jgi:hypothetical protein
MSLCVLTSSNKIKMEILMTLEAFFYIEPLIFKEILKQKIW